MQIRLYINLQMIYSILERVDCVTLQLGSNFGSSLFHFSLSLLCIFRRRGRGVGGADVAPQTCDSTHTHTHTHTHSHSHTAENHLGL